MADKQSHQHRFISVHRNDSFLYSAVQPQLLYTCSRRLQLFWKACFRAERRGTVRIWPGVSVWSEKIQPFSHPGDAANLQLVFPNLTNKGEWKQTFLQSTRDRRNMEGWRGQENSKRETSHPVWTSTVLTVQWDQTIWKDNVRKYFFPHKSYSH